MKKGLMLLGCLFLLLLSSCKTQETVMDTESTLYIKQDGKIESLVVEEFPEDQYSAEELQSRSQEIIDLYNQDHGNGAVHLNSCEVRDGYAYVDLLYRSADDYAKFNRVELFYGTVGEGLEKGYGKKTTLKNAYGTNMLSGDAIADLSSYHMLVVSEPLQIRTEEAVLYYSANLEHIDDRTVRVSSESNGEAILIVK